MRGFGNSKMPNSHSSLELIFQKHAFVRTIMAIVQSHNKTAIKSDLAHQKCINADCGETYGTDEVLTSCPKCGDLLDITYNWDRIQVPKRMSDFEQMWTRRHEPLRFSGVWRFHELLQFAPAERVITVGEGQTLLQQANSVARYVGIRPGQLYLQYEGMNPSGSFKDNGMSEIGRAHV